MTGKEYNDGCWIIYAVGLDPGTVVVSDKVVDGRFRSVLEIVSNFGNWKLKMLSSKIVKHNVTEQMQFYVKQMNNI